MIWPARLAIPGTIPVKYFSYQAQKVSIQKLGVRYLFQCISSA
jgi:hypothetical protein